MTYVYQLIDPEDKQVRYVGKSTHPKSRFKTHIAESRERQNTEKKKWIYGLLSKGMQPVLAIVAEFREESAAREKESEECHKHKGTIYNLHDPKKGAKAIRQRPKV